MTKKYWIFFAGLLSTLSISAQVIPNYNSTSKTDYTLIPVSKNNLFGFVDRHNKVVIEPKYDAVSFFNAEGLAQVKKGGLNGIIDRQGTELVPLFSKNSIGSRWTSNKSEKDVTEEFHHIFYLSNEVTARWMLFAPGKTVKTSGIYETLKPRFDDRVNYQSRSAIDNDDFRFGYKKIVTSDARVNFIDTNFNLVLPNYIINGFPLNADQFAVYDDQGRVGIYRKDGSVFIDPKYYSVENSGHPDYFIITVLTSTTGGNKGLIHKNGTLVLDTIYGAIWYDRLDHFKVNLNGNQGILNTKKQVIVPIEFSTVNDYSPDLYYARYPSQYSSQETNKNDQTYILNFKGEKVAGPYPSLLKRQNSPMTTATRNDSTLFIDVSGKIKFKLKGKFEVTSSGKEGMVVQFEGKESLINMAGKVIIEPTKGNIELTGFQDAVRVYYYDTNISGVYSFSLGWIHPADGSVHFVNYIAPNEKDPNQILTVEDDDHLYTYTNSLKNVVVKPLKSTHVTYSTLKINTDTFAVRLNSGATFKYPAVKDIEPQTNGRVVYFVKRENNQRVILNSSLKPLFPEGYAYQAVYEMNNTYVFHIQNKDRVGGLYALEGKWVFGPDKDLQTVQWLDGLWYLGSYRTGQLYYSNLKPVGSTSYATFNRIEPNFIVLKELEKNTVDIYSKTGSLLSSNTYSKAFGKVDNFVSVEKFSGGNLLSCITDTLIKEIQCYPYASVSAVEGNTEFLIAKDLYDFGVIKRNGDILVPFQYKGIRYEPILKMFLLEKGDYVYDLIRTNGEYVARDIKSFMNKTNLAEVYIAFQGRGDIYVFNVKTGKEVVFKQELGDIRTNADLAAAQLVTFAKDRNTIYADAETGVVYKLE